VYITRRKGKKEGVIGGKGKKNTSRGGAKDAELLYEGVAWCCQDWGERKKGKIGR